jgi:hypothetical protein
VGAGCFVGVIIQPASWLGILFGIGCAWYGLAAPQKRGTQMNTGTILVGLALLIIGLAVHVGIKRGWIK